MAERSRTGAPTAASAGDDVGRRLDGLRWRPVHTRITVALGIGWMLDAFEVNIVGNILGILKNLWHVTATQTSLLVSVWLIGIMIGAALFGYFADRYGRRKLFVGTLLLYSVFTVISALSPGYYWFLAFRFLTALGVGAEYSAVNAAIGELIPARYRGRASAIVMNFWPLGAILASFITLYFISLMPAAVGWRVAFALGAVIALFTLWARRVLPESPRWLAGKGRWREAQAISERLAADTRTFAAALPSRPSPGPRPERFRQQVAVLARRYPARLALGSALDFFEAFGYYGLFAMLPLVVLPELQLPDADTPWFFIIGNVGAAAGGLLAAFGLDGLGRKRTVTGFYLLAALAMFGMGLATVAGTAAGVLAAFTLANLCATGSWVAAYPTFAELFPTGMRASGIGFSVAVGRIGAAIAPPLLVTVATQISAKAAFGLMTASYALGGLSMLLWSIRGPEARARPLESLLIQDQNG
ncbi:MFS transporter [Salinisphaera sp. RV14]|uniref:MFS transporter n=1 Tax=Salinisphaera sp. RV14 TaxID=3454140 RepID=UPI003F864789